MSAKSIETMYEELRKLIDGSSESMTHEDAVATLQCWEEQRMAASMKSISSMETMLMMQSTARLQTIHKLEQDIQKLLGVNEAKTAEVIRLTRSYEEGLVAWRVNNRAQGAELSRAQTDLVTAQGLLRMASEALGKEPFGGNYSLYRGIQAYFKMVAVDSDKAQNGPLPGAAGSIRPDLPVGDGHGKS